MDEPSGAARLNEAVERRHFLGGAAAALIGPPVAARRPWRRPNLLFVFDDQHRAASMPGEPFSPVIAPTLAAFRRAGFSMDACVSNYPLCTPYRGIFLTGRWPFQTGLWRNSLSIRRDEVSLGRVFRDAGYRTAYVGKWHLQKGDDFIPAGPDRQGFDDWHAWVHTDDHYRSWTYHPDTGRRVQPAGWSPVTMTDQAIDLIRRPAGDQPWMTVVSYNPPHPPYDPPAAEAERYPGGLALRPNVAFPLRGRPGPGITEALTGEDAMQRAMRGYYGAITGVDAQFARLLAALDDTGQARDTIVVFTADHGEMLGAQGRMGKTVPFEESCRVPFTIRYPGITPSGGRSDVLFGAIDIYPTLCGLAGVPVPRHCGGRDLSAVMRGERLARRPTHAFLMSQQTLGPGHADDEPGVRAAAAELSPNPPYVNLPNYRGLRTDTHTYAVADSGRWLLYDNVADPYQLRNLVADPAQSRRMERFDRLIAAWLEDADDPFLWAENVGRLATFPT